MIKGTLNQLYNVNNPFQGSTKKVLCVCSAGLLRSATLQNFLIREYGYNVRNCGTQDYALIPISEALCRWADEIVFVDNYNYLQVVRDIEKFNIPETNIKVLNIPDNYNFNEPELIDIIKQQYNA